MPRHRRDPERRHEGRLRRPPQAAGLWHGGESGDEVGRFVFERFQGPDENCTLHNYNVVPLRSGKYVLVHGSYQAGTSVIDFTDLSNPREIAWSDPPPLPLVPEIEIAPGMRIPNPFCDGVGCEIGGA